MIIGHSIGHTTFCVVFMFFFSYKKREREEEIRQMSFDYNFDTFFLQKKNVTGEKTNNQKYIFYLQVQASLFLFIVHHRFFIVSFFFMRKTIF